MSTKIKLLTLISGMLLLQVAANSQNTLELTIDNNTAAPTGTGFGPRTSNHVITFDRDDNNNGNFKAQGANPNPITAPFITATISFSNQQYTGLTYGAGTTNSTGTSNAVNSGLMFGVGPTTATEVAPGLPATQQGYPLNSYDILGYFGNNFGPKNGMFISDPTATPLVSSYPTQSGAGIDVEANGGVHVFTCAQVMFDQNKVHNATTRHYFGDLVITFSRFVSNPVIHLAGLGASYRYAPVGVDPTNLNNWVSTFFTTELEQVGGFPLTKMAGNQYFNVSGNLITNSNTVNPNGESVDQGTPPAGQFNNFGAASGSVRVNGTVRVVRFKVYLRGASGSQFNWSAPGTSVNGAQFDPVTGTARNPLTGDIWLVSASLKREQLIPLPVTGMRLNAVLNSNNDVQLSWKTYSEIDSKEFVIERSTDGINFAPLGTKPAAGNSISELNYAYTDPSMQTTVYYYRLKQVDINGQFTYSNVVPVRRSAGNVKTVRAFPNPAVSQLNLEFSKAKGNYQITLVNQAGQEVASQKAVVNYEVQYVTVNRNSLPAGSYIVRIKNTESGETFNQNVILQ